MGRKEVWVDVSFIVILRAYLAYGSPRYSVLKMT